MTESLERWQRAFRGRIVPERVLATRGSMTVYLAFEQGRSIELHVLEPESPGARMAIERAAALRHEHILAIESTGTIEGALFWITPHLEGVTLRTWLEREHRLPFLESVRVLRELSEALAHAHRHGVVQGDLTADDVLWCETHVKLCGLGRAAAQRTEEQLDLHADIHAFGALAYQVLTGLAPFDASTSAESQRPRAPVNELRPHMPPGLAYLVMRCFERDPRRRWSTMDDIVRLLAGLVTPAQGYEAPQLVNQGEWLLRRGGDAWREALERFEAACAFDPRSARAHAGVARAACALAIHGFERVELARSRAEASVRRAIELDAVIVEAHWVAAIVAWTFAWDCTAARVHFERALELGPHDARVHASYAQFSSFRAPGEFDALAHAREAIELDPEAASAHAALARVLTRRGEHGEALASARRAVEIDPTSCARRRLGLAFAFADRLPESVDVLSRVVEDSSRHPWVLAAHARVLAAMGAQSEGRAIFDELVGRASTTAGVSAVVAQPSLVAVVAAALGRKEEAVVWLERAIQARDAPLVWDLDDGALTIEEGSVHSDSRWRALWSAIAPI